MVRPSITIVHVARPWTISRCPWTTKPSYTRRTNTQHLEKFQVFIAVTKSVTITTNPSSKLPYIVTSLLFPKWFSGTFHIDLGNVRCSNGTSQMVLGSVGWPNGTSQKVLGNVRCPNGTSQMVWWEVLNGLGLSGMAQWDIPSGPQEVPNGLGQVVMSQIILGNPTIGHPYHLVQWG